MKAYLRNIDQVSDLVRQRIEDVGERSKRPKLYEDIRKACLDERAFLFMDGESFFVLRPMPKKVVQVWVAYCREGKAIERYQEFLKQLCKNIGANQMELETALGDPFERHISRFGWSKAYTVWRQEL
ncbi:MAG: hypothetical protein KDA17_03865 [Candidatus Saccharibacteria bacterium]|nr:hypothetical protein [Candidatus Saccharibacteria bacterium]